MPLVMKTCVQVFAAERICAEDTTVLVLAKGKNSTGRVRTYVPIGYDGVGGCVIPSQAGQENFSRTNKPLSHGRVMSPSDSVLLADLAPFRPPQHGDGSRIMIRLGGKCSGSGRRAGGRRSKEGTVLLVDPAALWATAFARYPPPNRPVVARSDPAADHV